MLLLAVGGADAAERVMASGQSPVFPGDVIDLREMIFVLFPTRACELPLAMAKDMRAGTAKYYDGYHKICFGETLDGYVVTIDDTGHTNTAPKGGYTVAELREEEPTATVITSPYNRDKYEPCRKKGSGKWCLRRDF